MDGETGPADAARGRAMMTAVATTGVGDLDRLEVREVPRPRPGPGEALVRVLAAGVNNADINTRVGWYSSSVRSGTEGAAGAEEDGGWSGATPFPPIQGADCCGRIEALGEGAGAPPVGARVILRACMRPEGFGSPVSRWMGTDFDGAFAQFTVVPASEAFGGVRLVRR